MTWAALLMYLLGGFATATFIGNLVEDGTLKAESVARLTLLWMAIVAWPITMFIICWGVALVAVKDLFRMPRKGDSARG